MEAECIAPSVTARAKNYGHHRCIDFHKFKAAIFIRNGMAAIWIIFWKNALTSFCNRNVIYVVREGVIKSQSYFFAVILV